MKLKELIRALLGTEQSSLVALNWLGVAIGCVILALYLATHQHPFGAIVSVTGALAFGCLTFATLGRGG